jgi:hypothetical protein
VKLAVHGYIVSGKKRNEGTYTITEIRVKRRTEGTGQRCS